MKFATIAALVGVASTVEVEKTDDALLQESQEMEQLCQNMGEIDDESLLETEEGEEEDRKKIRGSYKQHYNRSKKQIDAENHHILSTQKKCLSFVKRYRGHPKVCNWCKKAKAPSVIWKWDPKGKVWYRWYDNKWHYWGPSKKGFTSVGWTWYKGFWHHNGWVFKYYRGYWYRFQGQKWVRYSTTVPIKPTVPRGPKICRPFYMLKKWGFPSSLGVKSLPRCRVGSGKSSTYYMWKSRSACKFLGGRLVYQKHRTCKTGRPHQWARVTRCVQGPILSKKGLNYKTGRSFRSSKSKREVILGGMRVGGCYKLRAYAHTKDYFSNVGTFAYNSPSSKLNVWRITKGIDGTKNSVTFKDRTNRYGLMLYSTDRARFYWNKYLNKKNSVFYVIKGLMGRGVSFMPVHKKGYFMRHQKITKGKTHTQIRVNKYDGKYAFKKAATWYAIKSKC
jgi:hypothetical protein